MKKYGYNYKEMIKNYEIIKTFYTKYGDNLMIVSALLAEKYKIAKYSDYMKLMQNLNSDVKLGNYLIGLLREDCIKVYSDILNNEMSFDDYIKISFGYDIYMKYLKKIEDQV